MPYKVSIEISKRHKSKEMVDRREVTENTKTGYTGGCLSSGSEANHWLAEGV